MYAISKLNKQHDQTWVSLQQRLNSVQFDYKTLFTSQDIYNFIRKKVLAVGSCEGYFVPTLLTTTSYVLATKGIQVQITTHKQPLNIYTLFIGYPGTGKSSAIQHGASEPLDSLDLTSSVISTATSSGLIKSIASNKKGILLSPEIYDCLNKLLKSDEDNATGDIQLLCKLFSGEKSSYVYSTEQTRTIDENTPFCILGSTQLRNAAKIIARMDHGHGLVDRFLITTPVALRPTLTEIEEAKDYIETEAIQDFNDYFQAIDHIDDHITYDFESDAKDLLRDTVNQFVNEVNEAITKGEMPPKSKAPDLIPRIATNLHVLNHIMEHFLSGLAFPVRPPAPTINKDTLQNAIALVRHLESQKEILCEFLKDITNQASEKAIQQPTPACASIKENVLLSPGPVVSFRSFKHSKRSLRSIAEQEYTQATEELQADGFGRIVNFRLPRTRGPSKVFVKSAPSPWPSSTVTPEQLNALSKPISHEITSNMREHLRQHGFISAQ